MFTRICKVCGKEDRFKDIQDHIEANHISGVTHTCDTCGKEAKTRNSLKVEVSSKRIVTHFHYENKERILNWQ